MAENMLARYSKEGSSIIGDVDFDDNVTFLMAIVALFESLSLVIMCKNS